MPNIALARKVLEHIERFPQHHYQGDWTNNPINQLAADNGDHPPCGTALCFAGWTAFLTAPKGSRMNSAGTILLPDGKTPHSADWTEELLGITPEQASVLFYSAQNLDDLKAVIDAIEAQPDVSAEKLEDIIL